MAKRLRSGGHVQGVPSSPLWHPAGGNSLWWRHYAGVNVPFLYRDCSPTQDARRCAPCCSLYNLHPSQGIYRLPSCCRTSAAGKDEKSREEKNDCKCVRVAIFDLDGTLITTSSGKKFPTSANDWKLLNEIHIPAQLRRLHSEGYHLFILSNQLGVARGHVALLDLTSKLDDIQQKLQVPLTACLCCCDDLYRKPRPTGAALLFQELLPRVMQAASSDRVSSDCSPEGTGGLERGCGKYPRVFFVGDAAGRPKDHSCADLKFALNAGMSFFTPEEFFLGHAAPTLPLVVRRLQRGSNTVSAIEEPKASGGQMFLEKDGKLKWRASTKMPSKGALFDPSELLKNGAATECLEVPNSKPEVAGSKVLNQEHEAQHLPQANQELVVLVGAPGSGKSTFVETLLCNHAVVRQDDLKRKDKCIDLCARFLKEGKSVVVDGQNARIQDREVFVNLARQHAPGCALRCIALLWPKELCLHLGQFRCLAAALRSTRKPVGSDGTEQSLPRTRYRPEKVPRVVVDMFYTRVELPTVSEGFGSVHILQDVAKDFTLCEDFCSSDEKELFGSFLD